MSKRRIKSLHRSGPRDEHRKCSLAPNHWIEANVLVDSSPPHSRKACVSVSSVASLLKLAGQRWDRPIQRQACDCGLLEPKTLFFTASSLGYRPAATRHHELRGLYAPYLKPRLKAHGIRGRISARWWRPPWCKRERIIYYHPLRRFGMSVESLHPFIR